jgi:hypothetical protein
LENLALPLPTFFGDAAPEDKVRRGRATLSIYVTGKNGGQDQIRKSLEDSDDTLLFLPALPDSAVDDDSAEAGSSNSTYKDRTARPSGEDGYCCPSEGGETLEELRPMLHDELDIHVYYLARRPDIAAIVQQEIDQSSASGLESIIAISCGPEAFVDAVRDAVRKKGIRYAEEGFG